MAANVPAYLFDLGDTVSILPAETWGHVSARRHLDGGNVYLVRHASGVRNTWAEDELRRIPSREVR